MLYPGQILHAGLQGNLIFSGNMALPPFHDYLIFRADNKNVKDDTAL